MRTEQEKNINKTEIGTYDGCKVTLHSIYESNTNIASHKFYIAKCKDNQNETTTTTEVFLERQPMGKSFRYEEKLIATITNENNS